MFFLLIGDWGVADTVERNFFQVAQVELPGDGGHGVVKRDALIVEEAWIITAYWELQTFEHQVTNRMLFQVECVAEHQIREWANLNANVFLNELIDKVGELENLETVTNTFAIK